MSEMIDQYLDELETSKEDIKQSLINKGVTPIGGLTSYAEAVDSIKSNLGTATVSITKNGTQTITAEEYGYDGMSKVDVTVKVATGGSDKPQIFNGFRFTGGDIAQVDFSQYDWSSVYDTSNFFQGCTHSTGDWTNFEENFNGDVLNLNYMFAGTSGQPFNAVKTLPNLGNKTADVTSTAYMCYYNGNFEDASALSQWDTSKVIDADCMFGIDGSTSNYTPKITSIDLTNFGSPDGYKADYMFGACNELESVIGARPAGSAISMFRYCSNLTTIPQLDTSKVTDMRSMFNGCSSLTSIPQLDTSKVTDMRSMFNGCSSLTSIPQLDTSNVTSIGYMFNECRQLTSIPQLDTSNVTSIGYMFSGCTSLVELPDFNCVKLTNFLNNTSYSSDSWLYNCPKLQKIGVVDCDSVTNIIYFFGDSSKTYLTDFGGCRNLGKASSVLNTNNNHFMNYAPNLTYESVMNVINGLYDRASAGLSVLTLKLHANHLAMLSEDDIAIATNKGWTIV